MKLKYVGFGILALVLIIGLTFGVLYHYKFFAPKFENARREVFENTRSFNQAKMQELSKYRLEYLKAEERIEKDAPDLVEPMEAGEMSLGAAESERKRRLRSEPEESPWDEDLTLLS